MGLDITAYRKLTPNYDADRDGDFYFIPGASLEWSDKVFPGRGEGIDARTVYSFTDSFRFYAGSYGAYNRWRDELARLVGHSSAEAAYRDPQPGPFIELINFADNEGVIGPVVAAKLARDFAEHTAKAQAHALDLTDGSYWITQYRNWQTAFETAADGGAVEFH